MSYADIYAAANEELFQGRCQVAMWTAAQDISADTGAATASKDWANSVLQDKASITPRQLAMQVLRNATIAAAPASASDGDIQFQVNSVLSALIALG